MGGRGIQEGVMVEVKEKSGVEEGLKQGLPPVGPQRPALGEEISRTPVLGLGGFDRTAEPGC